MEVSSDLGVGPGPQEEIGKGQGAHSPDWAWGLVTMGGLVTPERLGCG